MAEQKRFITVENICMIAGCGNKIGEFEVPVGKFPAGTEITLEMLGVEDSRCDACMATHGTYQEMERVFKRDVSEDHNLFKQYVTAGNRKLQDFYERVVIDFPEKLAGKKHKSAMMEAARVKFETDAGITELTAKEKIESIKVAKEKEPGLKSILRTGALNKIKDEVPAVIAAREQ